MALIGGGYDGNATPAISTLVERFSAGFQSAYCFGDGTGSACPCNNSGGADEGCANSTGVGATLTGTGCNAVSDDGLVFQASGLPSGQPALLFGAQNELAGGAGASFGDGLRCAGGAVKRLGITSADAAGVASWGSGLIASGGWAAGDTSHFQAWYRDPAEFCGSNFNLSNGVEVTLTP